MKKLAISLAISLFLISNADAAQLNQIDAQRFSAYYSNGMQYLKNQQYSSAITEFKKVLRVSPYDTTIQDALTNAYFARAQYFEKTTKEYKKALCDYKSAYFYARYWGKTTTSAMTALAGNAKNAINDLERKLQIGQTPATRLQTAKTLRAQGELAASAYDFQELKNGQYKAEALENLGNIYKNLNNLMFAMDYMKQALDLNPKNAKLHFLYGVMLDEANNYEASIEQYNLALQHGDKSPELLEILENKWTQNIVNNPADAQNYINLGAIYQKQGNLEAARAQYLKATQMDSNDKIGFYNLASLYVEQKNYPAALGVYNGLLVKNPADIEVLEYKAQILKTMNNFDEALKTYEKILAIKPEDKNAKANADDIILNHFSGEKLKNYLAQKAQLSPNSYEAQFNYALELHKNKNYNGAIEFYKKALALDPAKEECYLNLASIYIEQRRFLDAEEISQKGLLILPNNEKIKANLADAKNYAQSSQFNKATELFNLKRFKEAILEYQKITPQTPEIKLAIAGCYWELNDYQNANKYYKEILSSDPNNLEVLVNSAFAYYSMNDFNNARLAANKILSFDKNNKEALEILNSIEQSEFSNVLQDAINEYEKGNYQSALNLANKVLSKNPLDEYALYYKALCLDELKKPVEALKTYKTLVQNHPQFSEGYYSMAVNLDNSAKYAEAVTNYEKFLSLKGAQNDDMTEFSKNRIKELKDYLSQLNAGK